MSILAKACGNVADATGYPKTKLQAMLFEYYRVAHEIAMRYKEEGKPFILQLNHIGKIYNNDYEKQRKHENQETASDVHDSDNDDGQVQGQRD